MAYPTEELLEIAENKWTRVSSTDASITGDRLLVRSLKLTNDKRKASVGTLLASITSVTGPKADNGQLQSATAGDIYDVVSCGWDPRSESYVQVLKARAPYELDEITVADTVYETTTEKRYLNQEAPAASTTWIGGLVAGVSRQISAAADAMKKWTWSVQKTTSKPYAIDFIVPIQNGYTEHHYIRRNQPTLALLGAPAFGFINDYAGSPSQNPDGTWNWYCIVRPAELAVSAFGEEHVLRRSSFRYKSVKSVTDGQFWIGGSGGRLNVAGEWGYQRQQITEITGHKCFATAAEAWAYSGLPPSRIGHGIWMASISYQTEDVWQWEAQGQGGGGFIPGWSI